MMNIYEYESTDPKQKLNELAVSFYFSPDVTLDEADKYVTSMLMEIDNEVEYSFDMWTTPQKEDKYE